VANNEHVAMLKKGVDAWNKWRLQNPSIRPDLSKAVAFRGAFLGRVNLASADLTGADLTQADLTQADLSRADLSRADLTGALLSGARLNGADLAGARLIDAKLDETDLTRTLLYRSNLTGAVLSGARLIRASLNEADLTDAQLAQTIFAASYLANAQGLDRCYHSGPSMLDFGTLKLSGPLPVAFLRGVGLPDNLIEYLPSLLNEAIQHYSCFISYSSQDQNFAERLHADLQNKGVRCWFAPHDMRIGAKIIDAIDEAIRVRDKVLLILSEAAVASDWVEGEVTRALDEERKRKQVVLFPVRIDDAVMQTSEAWATLLQGQRNIGDFTGWKDHDGYRKSFDRLMRDLRVEKPGH
jgi:TIR domain-containing protein/pentapeptide repeat protein